MKLVSGTQMKALDARAIDGLGLPGLVLMENAGRAVADWMLMRWGGLRDQHVLVLAGKGNNGGDGMVTARALAERGVAVEVCWLADPKAASPQARTQHRILQGAGVPVVAVPDARALRRLDPPLRRADVVVDALLGIGVSGAVRGHLSRAIERVNRLRAVRVVALDVPSGVDADSGRVDGACVQAGWTLTLGLPKLGLLLEPGRSAVGELEVLPIGHPQTLIDEFDSEMRWLSREEIVLPARPPDGHKGRFGRVLVVAGSAGMSGAALLCVQAALRGGAGLVHVAYPRGLDGVLGVGAPEALKHPLPEHNGALSADALEPLLALSHGMDALALGSGLGQQSQTRDLVRNLTAQTPIPLVLDADGLNAFAGDPSPLATRRAPTVLTPHPGEFSRLCGVGIAEVEGDRPSHCRRLARQLNAVVALKGAPTLVVHPNGALAVNATGNVGLAKGGSGDVLTGLLAAFLAQGMNPFEATCMAVWVHGRVADVLRPNYGTRALLPGDVAGGLGRVLRELER